MYTIQEFQKEVIETKGKMEKLLQYLQSVDEKTKEILKNWQIDWIIKELREVMIPEMEVLLEEILKGAIPKKEDRGRCLTSAFRVIDSWPYSLPNRRDNKDVWDRITETGGAIVDLSRHYCEDLD